MAYTITNKMKTARNYLNTYLEGWDVVPEYVWDYLLDDDDFCNEVQKAPDKDSVEVLVGIYVDNAFDECGVSEFSNRDRYYDFH